MARKFAAPSSATASSRTPRRISASSTAAMCPEALEDAIAADRAQGLKPWLIVAAVGTTDTGEISPVDEVKRDGRIFLSPTLLDGRFTLRIAALSFRTHRKTIDLALRILGEQVEKQGT